MRSQDQETADKYSAVCFQAAAIYGVMIVLSGAAAPVSKPCLSSGFSLTVLFSWLLAQRLQAAGQRTEEEGEACPHRAPAHTACVFPCCRSPRLHRSCAGLAEEQLSKPVTCYTLPCRAPRNTQALSSFSTRLHALQSKGDARVFILARSAAARWPASAAA